MGRGNPHRRRIQRHNIRARAATPSPINTHNFAEGPITQTKRARSASTDRAHTETKQMTTTTKRTTRQCSRCEGTDPGCNVCQDEPQEALEWPTREDIEFLRDEAKALLQCTGTGLRGPYVGTSLADNGELTWSCSGFIRDTNMYVTTCGPTMERALQELRREIAKADPVAKLAAQARKQGFDIVKREEGKA